jgi:hypothetical protein
MGRKGGKQVDENDKRVGDEQKLTGEYAKSARQWL